MRLAKVTRAVLAHSRRNGWVITTPDALALGANSRQLAVMTRDGVITRRHPGVYVVTGTPADHRLEVRAALAAMWSTDRLHTHVASHASAAWLQGLTDHAPTQAHLTTTADHSRSLAGVVVHRTAADKPLERRMFHGIACTAPPRTLVDLAATATPAELADAVDRALSKGVVRTRDLDGETRMNPSRRGTAQLRRCLSGHGYTGMPAPSVLESRMARLLTHFGLPVAIPQCTAGPDGEYRLDYAYPARRLMVELYGYTWHHSPEQMTGDLARQRRLTLEGWTVLIFTWQDVTDRPQRVAEQLRAVLGGARVKSDSVSQD